MSIRSATDYISQNPSTKIFSTATVSITPKLSFQLTIILAILGTLGVGIASLITVLNVQTQQAAQMSEFIIRIIYAATFHKQKLYLKNCPLSEFRNFFFQKR